LLVFVPRPRLDDVGSCEIDVPDVEAHARRCARCSSTPSSTCSHVRSSAAPES
jgi:hypothetical protein